MTAAKDGADVADVMANGRGKYRAYRISANGSMQLTNEYTNTATPLPDGSIAYSNGSNLVVRSGSERRSWNIGRFNWGPVAMSCNRDASVIALTKWKGDHRKLFSVQLESGATATSTFSYYSYVLKDADIYYALGSGIKRCSLVSGETEALTGKVFTQTLLDLFGLAEPQQHVVTNIGNLTFFQGRLLTSVLLLHRENGFARLAHAVISWTPQETDIRIEFNAGPDGRIDTVASDGETAVVSYRLAAEPASAMQTFAVGPSARWIYAGWNLAGVAWLPDHGFQFLPG